MRSTYEEALKHIPDRKGYKGEGAWLQMDILWAQLKLDFEEIVLENAVDEFRDRASHMAEVCEGIIKKEEDKYDNYVFNDSDIINLSGYLSELKDENEKTPKQMLKIANVIRENAEEIIKMGKEA